MRTHSVVVKSVPALHNAYMPPKRRFGPNRLKAIRRARRLSQEELAEGAGVTHATISRLETGKQALGQPLLDDLALVLRVSRGQIFDGPVPPTPDDE